MRHFLAIYEVAMLEGVVKQTPKRIYITCFPANPPMWASITVRAREVLYIKLCRTFGMIKALCACMTACGLSGVQHSIKLCYSF